MPIDFVLDHKHRLVLITMHGEVGIADIVTSAHKIMAISDVGGYNTIADISNVETMPQFSAVQLNQLALLFLGAYPLDTRKPRLALIAANDAVHGVARSFEDYCDSGSSSHKRVGVFRTFDGSAGFLQLSSHAVSEKLRTL